MLGLLLDVAVEWAPQDSDFLQVLAAAYAENRQFEPSDKEMSLKLPVI